MTIEFRVGDWVTAYHPGIWQVYRILDYRGLDPRTEQETVRTAVFSKRFVSRSFRRSFSAESCSPFFVKPLDPSTKAALDEFISNNPLLIQAFMQYEPPPIGSIYNARIGIPRDLTPSDVEALIPRGRLFTELEIGPFLRSCGFDTKGLPSWTVQFVSEDHRCDGDGYIVYEFSGVHAF